MDNIQDIRQFPIEVFSFLQDDKDYTRLKFGMALDKISTYINQGREFT